MDTAVRTRTEDLIGQVDSLIDELVDLPLAMPVHPQEAMDRLRALEVTARKVRAVQLALADAVDRSEVWRTDGHRRGHQLVAHACRLSGAEDLRRDRSVRALRDLPAVAAALRTGTIGAPQVERIAATWANPRVRDAFIDLDTAVAELAAREPYPVLDRMLANWEAMEDETGSADRAAAAHRDRDAAHHQRDDGAWHGRWNAGTLDGARMADIHRAFTDAETLTDWDHARHHHGDTATVADLPRTDAQRRFDALRRIFDLAAAAWAIQHPTTPIETVIVIDEETFDRHLRRIAGQHLPTRLLDLHGNPQADSDPETDPTGPATADDWATLDEPVDLADIDAALDWRDEQHARRAAHRAGRPFRSHTIDGHYIDPTEAVANALVSHVRRAVVTAASVTIDLGRRQRLFTGHTQLATRLAATTCYWPACRITTSRTQTDHLRSWRQGGSTDPTNGAPACAHHNRLKEHGYTVRRAPDGTLHIHRPDGTQIN
jgi:hypothetical protein